MSRTISQIKTVGDLKKIIDNLNNESPIVIQGSSDGDGNYAEIMICGTYVELRVIISQYSIGWISSEALFHVNPDYLT